MTSLMAAMLMANDTSFSAKSGNPKPMSNVTQVEMANADIRIKVPSCEVTVTYTFKNTGKKETVTMGFPEEGYDAYLDANQKTWFKSFKSWVDGKPEIVLAQKIDDPESDPDFGYKVWWVKKIEFAESQTRSVKNVYVSQPGGDTLPRHFFEYIVHTAKTWKGNIGKLRLEVDTSGMAKGTHFGFVNKPHKVDGTKFAWFWANFEPSAENDMVVSWQVADHDYGDMPNWKQVVGPEVFVAGE